MTTQLVCSELLGRDSEYQRLADVFSRTARDEIGTVLIGGEAGVGKSRLVAEFLATRAADARMLLGGCVELSSDGLPFAPFIAALRGLIDELTGSECADLTPLIPGATCAAARGEEARPRLFESMLGLLARLAEDRGTVLVIEDAHWADRSSRDLLDFLVRNQQAAPGLMIIVTHRSDELARNHPLRPLLAELGRLAWVERTELDRLSKKDVMRQVRGILNAEPDPEVVRVVYERSEGNPLFVEALLDCGNPSAGAIPASLEDWLLSKIDKLPAETAWVVRVAGAGSARTRHALLAEVSELGEPALSRALRHAVEENVLAVDGDDYYVFRHALFRDAVYRNLLPGERIDLHTRYAAALRADAALAAEARCATELAHHLYAAYDAAGAIWAAWTAAREAGRSLAYAEQLQMLERVLELWEVAPECAEHIDADYLTVLEQAAEAAARAGEHARGERLATALIDGLDHDNERVRTALALEQRARMRTQLGTANSVEDHREAVRLVPADHPARGYLLNALAARLMEIPLHEEARQTANEALEAARRAGDDPTEASALISIAVLDSRMGVLDDHLPMLAKARAIAESAGAHRVRLRSLHCESHLLQAFGRLAEAERVAREGLAAAQQIGLARSDGALHAIDLAGPLVSAGKWDEALDSIGYGLELAPSADHQAHLLCFKAYIALQRGEFDLPERAVSRCRELLADGAALTQDPMMLPRLEVELRLRQGRVGDALLSLRHALALPNLIVSSRFTWPLLVLGARVAGAARDGELLATLRACAAEVRTAGPVQLAGSVTFTAEATRAEERPDPEAWQRAVRAWDELGQPLRLAQALLGHAEAVLATGGQRDLAVTAVHRAVELAEQLGATPLCDETAELARRARLPLAGSAPQVDGERLGLTPRELEILRLVCEGLGNRDIAQRLFISAKTASVHVSNILGKLGVTNRVEAAAAAHRHGIS